MAGSHPLPLLGERHFAHLKTDDLALHADELEEDEREEEGHTGDWWDTEPGASGDEESVADERGGAGFRAWDGRCNGAAVHLEAELAAAGLPRIAIEVRPHAAQGGLPRDLISCAVSSSWHCSCPCDADKLRS